MSMAGLRWSPSLATLGVFCAALALCAARFPVVLSGLVIGDLLTDNAVLGIAAVGMTVVIISGGIDLSVGAVAAFTSMFIAVAIERWNLAPPAAFALIIVLATGFGAAIGAAINRLRTPPFILTLAAMFLARGGCFLLSKEAVPIKGPLFAQMMNVGLHIPGGVELSLVALLMLGAFAAVGLLLHRTPWGATVFAIGGDRRAAELMGLPVASTTVSIYALSAACASIAGIALTFYTGAGNPLGVQGLELDAIAATVIGGALLSGGSGRMVGTLLGVMIKGLILLYITFDGRISSWWTKILIGGLLFAFVGFQKLMSGWAARETVYLTE